VRLSAAVPTPAFSGRSVKLQAGDWIKRINLVRLILEPMLQAGIGEHKETVPAQRLASIVL